MAPALNGIDTPTKPRLVGLSQPFFASPSPLEDPDKQLAAIERVTAQAVESGEKIRVLVAEDNKVNQEVVLRMLKLEDIYGTASPSPHVGSTLMLYRCHRCKGRARSIQFRQEQHGSGQTIQPDLHGRPGTQCQLHTC